MQQQSRHIRQSIPLEDHLAAEAAIKRRRCHLARARQSHEKRVANGNSRSHEELIDVAGTAAAELAQAILPA